MHPDAQAARAPEKEDFVEPLAYAGAALMGLLGVLHLLYTLQDFGANPRYFRPLDRTLLAAMRSTKTAIAPGGRDYWSGVLGFNLSHSAGVLMFALLICLATSYAIDWLKPLVLLLGIGYAAIAYRCWFNVPMFGALLATGLAAASWFG
jgi:hypothetical protein